MEGPQGHTPVAVAINREITQLYDAEAPGMLRYAAMVAGNPETAQDALQVAFFRFFIARSAERHFQSPKAWLYRVVRNYVLDQKRSFSRNEVGIESALNLPCPMGEAPGFTGSELVERAAGIGLSAREIECVRLRTEGLRYEDIAGVLGLRSGTVGALLARAHGKIRQAQAAESARNELPNADSFALPLEADKRYAS